MLVALIYIILRKEVNDLKDFLKSKGPKTAFTSLVMGIRYGTFLFLISKIEVSLISPLVSLGTLVELGLGSLILKEKAEKRWLAAILMVAGAMILAYRIA